MRVEELDFHLPPELIAQRPLGRRDASRLLILDKSSGRVEDRHFFELAEVLRGDELMILNNTKVIPARLFGRRAGVRAEAPGKKTRRQHLRSRIEVLLTRQMGPNVWEALVRPGRKMPVGERVTFGDGALTAEVIARGEYGVRTMRLTGQEDLAALLEKLGHVPLPPYIDRPDEVSDKERYQTVYARQPGAVAAPTAGLHFTPETLERLRERGIEVGEITLHVGLGTFQPIRTEHLESHKMHGEDYEISEETAGRIAGGRAAGRSILAVGTTVVRALEDSAARAVGGAKDSSCPGGAPAVLAPGKSVADIFIYSGYRFRVVDALLTNFHLPKSSLLALVCAFAGREQVLGAYRHAVEEGYRFYSYGDCMLIH